MKAILGVVGSPRRNGNTHILVSEVLRGAREAGARTSSILLGDLAIRECDGCHACWKGKSCSKKDDMNRLYAGIAGSDTLVLGTPVYWYGPTALMKGFLDRFVYFNGPAHREQVRGKDAALVIPFEEEDPAMAAGVISLFEKSLAYLEIRLSGTVIAPGVGKKGEIRNRRDKLDEAFDLGRRLGVSP